MFRTFRVPVICVLSLIFTNSPARSQEQQSIAVLPLQGNGITASEATVLTEELRSVLVQTGMYAVLERNNMESILNEQGFQMGGCTSMECAVEAGKLLGVSKMIGGSVGKIGALYNISLRIFDVETGKIENTVSRRHEGSIEQLLDVIKKAGQELAQTGTRATEETGDRPDMDKTVSPQKMENRRFVYSSSFSIRGGLTSTSTTLISDSRGGFNMGAAYHWHLYRGLFLQPELYFTTREFKYEENETMNFESIQPALLISYRVAPISNFSGVLMFSAGPAFNFILNATKHFQDDSTGESYTYDLKNYDGNDLIRANEMAIVLMPGIGYAFGTVMLSLEFRYEISLVTLLKDDYDWEVGKSRVQAVIVSLSF